MTFPIVLAHGVCRFDALWNEVFELDNSEDESSDNLHYFRGVRSMFRKKGYRVFHSNVPWGAKVDSRAGAMRRNIQQVLNDTGAGKVNIIAHSMGGLDARRMLFNDRDQGRIHERVASLTTLSTPHWGSAFADWALERFGQMFSLARHIGMEIDAFRDLTVKECRRFNENPEVIEFEQHCAEQVKFQTYAGQQDFWGIFSAMKLPFHVIEEKEGPNDGLVSVRSAAWRDDFFKGAVNNTDHINILGWWDISQVLSGESDMDLLRRIHELYADIAAGLP
jgi:triacylglycerol lipase